MSSQLGTTVCSSCETTDSGETVVSFLSRTRVSGALLGANLNTTEDQPIVIPDVSKWVLHRAFISAATGAPSVATGGIYTGPNKTGELVVPASQLWDLGDSSSCKDLTGSIYSDSHFFTESTLYLSLSTPEGTEATCDLFIIFEDLNPASLTVTPNQCVTVVNVPGPRGLTGTSGADGTDGSAAYTATTGGFTQPAASTVVTVSVADTAWMGIGQIVYVVGGGWYSVSATSATTATLLNLDYSGNAAPTTVIGSGAKVSPSGPEGAGGSSIVTDFDDIAPAGVAGTMIVHDGSSYAAFPAVLNNYRVPRIDTTQSNKISWSLIDLSNFSLLGQLPVASGGTGAGNAASARTNLGTAQSGSNSDITGLSALTSIKVGASGATITSILTATAALDFPNTANNAASDLTITVTGAAVGDAVFLGLPSTVAAGVFFGYVSAADTVTVRFRNDTGSSVNPASATYRATVVHV